MAEERNLWLQLKRIRGICDYHSGLYACIKRARALLRKGQKPVLDSKGKPVKNLTQKAGPGKPMSDAAKKQLKRFLDKQRMKRPKTGPKTMRPLMREAAKGMRKGVGSKNLRSAAKKLKRIM